MPLQRAESIRYYPNRALTWWADMPLGYEQIVYNVTTLTLQYDAVRKPDMPLGIKQASASLSIWVHYVAGRVRVNAVTHALTHSFLTMPGFNPLIRTTKSETISHGLT